MGELDENGMHCNWALYSYSIFATMAIEVDFSCMMGLGRQKDHSTALLRRQKVFSQLALCDSVCRRPTYTEFAFCHTTRLLTLTKEMVNALRDYQCSLIRSNYILAIEFSCNFNFSTDLQCIHNSRFKKAHIAHLVFVLGCWQAKIRTRIHRYRVPPSLATCIILRRLATPARWIDLQELFGIHVSQRFELFGR